MDISLRINLGIGGEYGSDMEGGYREPRHSVRVEGDYVVVEVELPGVDKEGITVRLVDYEELMVRAEGGDRKYLLIERLPLSVSIEGSQATYRNGLLIVKLPIKGVRIGVE